MYSSHATWITIVIRVTVHVPPSFKFPPPGCIPRRASAIAHTPSPQHYGTHAPSECCTQYCRSERVLASNNQYQFYTVIIIIIILKHSSHSLAELHAAAYESCSREDRHRPRCDKTHNDRSMSQPLGRSRDALQCCPLVIGRYIDIFNIRSVMSLNAKSQRPTLDVAKLAVLGEPQTEDWFVAGRLYTPLPVVTWSTRRHKRYSVD